MPARKANRPRSKHTEFALTQFRLVGNDWIIIIWCPHNRQACLFLAEPTYAPDKRTIISYWVTALQRVGESKSALRGLPRSFKTPDLAAEWLEEEVDKYKGDVFAGKTEEVTP